MRCAVTETVSAADGAAPSARQSLLVRLWGFFWRTQVISALADEHKRALHVPYRDSKLTRLLQVSECAEYAEPSLYFPLKTNPPKGKVNETDRNRARAVLAGTATAHAVHFGIGRIIAASRSLQQGE